MEKVSKERKDAAKGGLLVMTCAIVWICIVFLALTNLGPLFSLFIVTAPVWLLMGYGAYIAFIAEVEDE